MNAAALTLTGARSLLYCFAIGMRAGSTGKPETMQEGVKNHDVQEM